MSDLIRRDALEQSSGPKGQFVDEDMKQAAVNEARRLAREAVGRSAVASQEHLASVFYDEFRSAARQKAVEMFNRNPGAMIGLLLDEISKGQDFAEIVRQAVRDAVAGKLNKTDFSGKSADEFIQKLAKR